MQSLLKLDGEVERPQSLSFEELAAIEPAQQEIDVRKLGFQRGGDAIRLSGVLDLVGLKSSARFLHLHASKDDFHVCVALEPIRESALLIYRIDGKPLDQSAGGPIRFFIPDHVPCQTGEFDACANVKFVDHIELLSEKGKDSRNNS